MLGMGTARPNNWLNNLSTAASLLTRFNPAPAPVRLSALPISRPFHAFTQAQQLVKASPSHSFSHLSSAFSRSRVSPNSNVFLSQHSNSLLNRRPQLNGATPTLIQRRSLSCFGRRAATHESTSPRPSAFSPAGTAHTHHPGEWTQWSHFNHHHYNYDQGESKHRTEGRWQRRWRTRHACGSHGLLDFGRIRPEFFWGRLERYHKGLFNHKHSEHHLRKHHKARARARARGSRCHHRVSPDEFVYSKQEWIRQHRARDSARQGARGLMYFAASHLPKKSAYTHKTATVLPQVWRQSFANADSRSSPSEGRRCHMRVPREKWSDVAYLSPTRQIDSRPTPHPLLRSQLRPLKPRSSAESARAFSSTPRTEIFCPPVAVLQAGIPLLLPLMTVLKSSAALNVIGVASRIALTLLPLSLRGKFVYAVRERYAREPNPSALLTKMMKCVSDGTAKSGSFLRFNAVFLAPALALLPFVLLGTILLASLERTPVTGRIRVLMVSPAEEAELVQNILATGETAPGAGPADRDWVQILRTALELPDEGVSAVTGRRLLLGGEVLDERDWRVRWTKSVLGALQAGVPTLAHDGATTVGDGQDILHAPPTAYPLKSRTTSQCAAEMGWKAHLMSAKHGEAGVKHEPALLADYELIVIDRAESNSFAFGFGPDEIDASPDSRGTRGVICVYTGFIDEILGRSPQALVTAAPTSQASSSFFGGLFPTTRKQPTYELPNMVPDVMPTQEQTKALAVLLSHELAHLVLSHTLESYASTSLLIPHLSKLTSDVVRTLLFPVTAILGPFLNDAIGRSMNEGALGSWGCLGQVVNSCESRKLETEADLVALRLLANSGIDPRIALDFWTQRVDEGEGALAGGAGGSHSSHAGLRPHSSGEHGASAFMRTHPVNADRVRAIRNELQEWARLQNVSLA